MLVILKNLLMIQKKNFMKKNKSKGEFASERNETKLKNSEKGENQNKPGSRKVKCRVPEYIFATWFEIYWMRGCY